MNLQQSIQYIEDNMSTITAHCKQGDLAAEELLWAYDDWLGLGELPQIRAQVLLRLEIYLTEQDRKARVG